MKELEVTLERSESAAVLHAVGRVDNTTANLLEEPLLRAAEDPGISVTLDLHEVSFVSSAGLRVLLLAAQKLQARGERLKLIHVPPNIYSILNIAGFCSFIDVHK